MWISSAPLRISLASGGTDVPSYARRFGGTVLGATTDLRVTVVGRRTGAHRHIRACLDECSSTASGDIANPFAREALRRHWDGSPLELASFGDVPGGSGLGSSSAFCVALVSGLENGRLTPGAAAEAASSIEMHGLGRPVGLAGPVPVRVRRLPPPALRPPTVAWRWRKYRSTRTSSAAWMRS
ncbi:hypothetical protein GCM10020000_77360 [Streptomyces olivoverticillatus]